MSIRRKVRKNGSLTLVFWSLSLVEKVNEFDLFAVRAVLGHFRFPTKCFVGQNKLAIEIQTVAIIFIIVSCPDWQCQLFPRPADYCFFEISNEDSSKISIKKKALTFDKLDMRCFHFHCCQRDQHTKSLFHVDGSSGWSKTFSGRVDQNMYCARNCYHSEAQKYSSMGGYAHKSERKNSLINWVALFLIWRRQIKSKTLKQSFHLNG